MTFSTFHETPLGRAVSPLLADVTILDEMVALSRAGRPAVEAIGPAVARLAPDADDTTKQHLGRMVRDALARRGWKPARKARVRPGSPFHWGAVYAPIAAAPDSDEVDRRVARARAILREAGVTLPTVDEFLAERRAMWGE